MNQIDIIVLVQHLLFIHKNAASNIEQVLTPQDTNYMATCLPSWKLYKLDEPDM